MKRQTRILTSFLLNPRDSNLNASVLKLLKELKSFEGKTFQEMMDELDEINRHETREQMRRLRTEVAEYLTESRKPELPYGLSPSDLRQHLFSAVWERGLGFVTSEDDLFQPSASEFYADVAQRLNLDPSTLRDSLYADIHEAHRVGFPENSETMSPASIVGALNLRRLKRKLRRAASVRLRIPQSVEGRSPYTSLLWSLKRNRLMYDTGIEGPSLLLTIRGPGTLIEKSTVYGNRLASFTASLLHYGGAGVSWRLEAEIMERAGGSVSQLHLDSTMQYLFAGIDAEEDDFKSSDEAAFQRAFDGPESVWQLLYEATIIPLTRPDGTHAGFMIPDFVARNKKDGRQALIEIVGFWREEYLRRKIEKVGLLGPSPIFLMVNRRLSADRSALDPVLGRSNVVVMYYSGKNELKAAASKVLEQLDSRSTPP